MATENQLQQVVESTVMGAAKVVEEQLDAEIERLDNLDSDDLEKLREVSSVKDCRVRYTWYSLTVVESLL